MKILKFRIFFLQVPLSPASCYVDLVEESVALEVTNLDFWHRDLNPKGNTLSVEYVWSILYLQNYIINLGNNQHSIILSEDSSNQ